MSRYREPQLKISKKYLYNYVEFESKQSTCSILIFYQIVLVVGQINKMESVIDASSTYRVNHIFIYIYIIYRPTCELTLKALSYVMKILASLKGFFQFEIIINVLVSSLQFIWIPMLWVTTIRNILILQCGERLLSSESDVYRLSLPWKG